VTPVQRQLRADARRNHDRLIAAAREAFAEHGLEATLDDIVKRAALGPGTLYRHFPNRDALLAAVYRGDVEGLAARAAELSETLSPADALAVWLGLQLDYIKYKKGLGMAVKAILGADSETMAYCRDTMRGALTDLLVRAQQTGDVRTDVDAADVLRLVHGIGLACEATPESAARLLPIVLDGLRPPSWQPTI
jgi:AcrR family transcriptional regulator